MENKSAFRVDGKSILLISILLIVEAALILLAIGCSFGGESALCTIPLLAAQILVYPFFFIGSVGTYIAAFVWALFVNYAVVCVFRLLKVSKMKAAATIILIFIIFLLLWSFNGQVQNTKSSEQTVPSLPL